MKMSTVSEHGFNDRRVEWKIKNKVMQTIVDAGGIVFGGAVRDKCLHDMHADAFYEKCEDVLDDRYDDHNFMPELHGRWAIPVDIDATIHADKVDALMTAFAKSFGKVRKVFERDAKKYLPNIEVNDQQLRHMRVQLMYCSNTNARAVYKAYDSNVPSAIRDEFPEIRLMMRDMLDRAKQMEPIVVDLLVSMTDAKTEPPEAPFGHIDFRCNALLMDKTGIRLSRMYRAGLTATQRVRVLGEVLKEIEGGVAMAVGPTEWYRVCKMRAKGWKVKGCFSHVRVVKETDYNGHCIICHDQMHEGDYHPPFHMKLACCDARYHMGCMIDAIQKGEHAMERTMECIMCKKNVLAIGRDGVLLEAVYENGNVEALEEMA